MTPKSAPGQDTAADPLQAGWTRHPEPVADEIGQVLDGRFKIVERIGSGGMGSVFLCEDLALRSRAAVKVLRLRDPDARRRFFDEAALLANLRNPALVQVLAVGEAEDGVPYMALEYLGESLSGRLQGGGALPWREAVDIADQIAGALAVAHRAGVVHRDIKPGNIVQVRGVTGRTLVKLIDLGVARVDDWEFVQAGGPRLPPRRATLEGQVLGTPGFVPPEAGKCRPDPRFDIFSLGVTLYKLCTGMMPESPNPRPMRAMRPDLEIPAELEAVVARAMATDPEQRTRSAESFASELRAIRTAHAGSGPQEPLLFDECYELLELLGVGAKAEVYRAYHRDRRCYVALKLLREEMLADEEERRRLDREARVLSALSHPAIPELVDCRTGASRRRPFIAMELRSGRRVGDFWPERLEPAEVIAVGRQIAAALVEMAARGIIHRDLSSSNVLIDLDTRRGGRPIASIIDLGQADLQDMFWARADERYPTPPEARTRLGTGGLERLAWTAPEARAGAGWTGRSDVYSLGLLLYLLLTGKRPTKDEEGEWVSPAEIVPECPEALVDALRGALREDPAHRLDAAGLLSQLDEAAEEVRAMELMEASARSSKRASPAASDPQRQEVESSLTSRTGSIRPLIAGIAGVVVVALAWTLGYAMGTGPEQAGEAVSSSISHATASSPLSAPASPEECEERPAEAVAAAEEESADLPATAPAPAGDGDVSPASTPQKGLGAGEFRRVIDPQRGRLDRCVRDLGDDVGPLRASVRISREGSVKSVRLDTEVPYVVERCITAALESLRFPGAEGSSNHTLTLGRT